MGVLQRLAFIYFIAATLETIFMKPQPYFTVNNFFFILLINLKHSKQHLNIFLTEHAIGHN